MIDHFEPTRENAPKLYAAHLVPSPELCIDLANSGFEMETYFMLVRNAYDDHETTYEKDYFEAIPRHLCDSAHTGTYSKVITEAPTLAELLLFYREKFGGYPLIESALHFEKGFFWVRCESRSGFRYTVHGSSLVDTLAKLILRLLQEKGGKK
jgi:hypothetical protein